ncbi:MAG: hypothetical protein DRI74_08780 [Bacteroidetes bacterium]|nr:MAG: hypothetical protein DRI74_08780 [Bacteroidota bacterium]
MIDIYKDEIWVDIKVDNMLPSEKFQVSNFGRLKSFKVSENNPKIIKGSQIAGYGIIVIKLKNNKSNTFYIHKLVAENFVKKENENQNYVIHLDFINNNNYYKNLKWVSKEEQKYHRHNDKDYDIKKIRNSKLTEIQVSMIKKMLARGTMKPYRIAQQFGISQTQLIRIKNGTNWGHVKIN